MPDYTIKEDPQELEQVYQNVKKRITDRPRSKGIHISDLTLCPTKSYYRITAPMDFTHNQALMYITGFAFQEYMYPLEEQEVEYEGIYCSPDVYRGVEVKSTRMSMNKFDISKHVHWVRQMAGYAKVIGKREYNLTVLFLVGGYATTQFKPALKTYKMTFTKEFLEQNWKEMQERRALIEQALKDGVPPPIGYALDWECGAVDKPVCENLTSQRCLPQIMTVNAFKESSEQGG
jgi:hypothetical protein